MNIKKINFFVCIITNLLCTNIFSNEVKLQQDFLQNTQNTIEVEHQWGEDEKVDFVGIYLHYYDRFEKEQVISYPKFSLPETADMTLLKNKVSKTLGISPDKFIIKKDLKLYSIASKDDLCDKPLHVGDLKTTERSTQIDIFAVKMTCEFPHLTDRPETVLSRSEIEEFSDLECSESINVTVHYYNTFIEGDMRPAIFNFTAPLNKDMNFMKSKISKILGISEAEFVLSLKAEVMWSNLYMKFTEQGLFENSADKFIIPGTRKLVLAAIKIKRIN